MASKIITVSVFASFGYGSQALVVNGQDSPFYGCGLLGALPGISADGSSATPNTQRMIDELKSTSELNKVHYWNWNLATDAGAGEFLTKDFLFMPENWGVNKIENAKVRTASTDGFYSMDGRWTPATMSDMFLGANEPDMTGSCMGNMMGRCTAPCSPQEVADYCPVAELHSTVPADPLPNGHCDCWTSSHATGCGFWPVDHCSDKQPLPNLWTDGELDCINWVVAMGKQTASVATAKGYKYLSTPLVAWNMEWIRNFLRESCKGGCVSPECGCPSHIGWHFYASDCRPKELGGYQDFQNKLDISKQLMTEFPFLKGAIVNEVGMLNCNQHGPDGACVPNGADQKYPANKQPDERCPSTDELPNGLGTFLLDLMDMVINAKMDDGRPVVTAFSWFNLNGAGGTYNLDLFNQDGSINEVGEAYIQGCNKWASSLGLGKNATKEAAI